MCCDLLQTNRNFKNMFLPSVPGFSCKGLFQGENGTKTQRLSQDQGQCDGTDQTHAPGNQVHVFGLCNKFVVALN